MKPVYRNIIVLCLFFSTVAIIWYWADVRSYITLKTIKDNHDVLCALISRRPYIAACIYIASFSIMTIAAFPVTLLMIIVGGFLFNFFIGSFYAFLSMLISSTCVFFASQKMFGVYLHQKYAYEFKKYSHIINKYTFYSLLSMRFLPIIPFFIVNVCAGLMHVDIKTFLITTIIGIIPTILICSYLGSQCISIIVNW